MCVDDILRNFIKNLNNVVLIRPFVGDAEDTELKKLSEVLKSLAKVKDVREEIKERYNLLAHVASQGWHYFPRDK